MTSSIDRLERLARRWDKSLGPAEAVAPQGDLPNLLDFVPQLSRTLVAPAHLALVAQRIEACCTEPIRCIVSLPPRHGKTELLKHAIVWLLLARPDLRIAYASYGQQYSSKRSGEIRKLARKAGIQLARDSQSKQDWRTSTGIGGLWATSVNGPITGEGFDLIVIDDPVRGRADAESPTVRERTLEWFKGDVLTRLEPGGSVVICQTRWHPDDLAGQLSAEPGWDTLNLPALNPDGEALWPDRWSAQQLLRIQSDQGGPDGYEWTSLYMGRPRGRGNAVFRDVQRYDGLPPLGLARISIGLDLAYSKRTSADYSVAVVLAEIEGTYYVLDVVRVQKQPTEFRQDLKVLWEKYPTATGAAYVAATEGGSIALLREGGLPITELRATLDKFSRALPLSGAWNTKKILLPHAAEWLDKFTSELMSFTGVNDRHDDQVDALAAAFDSIRVHDIDWAFMTDLKQAWPQAFDISL